VAFVISPIAKVQERNTRSRNIPTKVIWVTLEQWTPPRKAEKHLIKAGGVSRGTSLIREKKTKGLVSNQKIYKELYSKEHLVVATSTD